jgi:hypothetical protein
MKEDHACMQGTKQKKILQANALLRVVYSTVHTLRRGDDAFYTTVPSAAGGSSPFSIALLSFVK